MKPKKTLATLNLNSLKTLLQEIIIEQATREYSGLKWGNDSMKLLEEAIPSTEVPRRGRK